MLTDSLVNRYLPLVTGHSWRVELSEIPRNRPRPTTAGSASVAFRCLVVIPPMEAAIINPHRPTSQPLKGLETHKPEAQARGSAGQWSTLAGRLPCAGILADPLTHSGAAHS